MLLAHHTFLLGVTNCASYYSLGARITRQQPTAAVEDDAGNEGRLRPTKMTTVASPPRPRRPRSTHTPYLHRRNANPGIPHPPAAGAAAGGWEIPRIRRRTLVEPGSPSGRLWYCRERGEGRVPEICGEACSSAPIRQEIKYCCTTLV